MLPTKTHSRSRLASSQLVATLAATFLSTAGGGGGGGGSQPAASTQQSCVHDDVSMKASGPFWFKLYYVI
jgi:deoxyribose-phosphate aldolase